MKDQFKALQMSLAIHALIFLIVLGISNSIIPMNKPIVIDFSVVDSQQSTVRSQKSEVRNQKPEVRSQNPEIEKIEKKTESPIPNPQSPIFDTHPSPISETQVPVPSVAQSRVEQGETKSEGHTLASPRTGSSSGDKNGTDVAHGNSEEKARMKYLKEHFAHIRDTIMKNLSYPHMARKMGWEGKVTVSFVIYESGHVENVKVLESSGFGMLDKSAVETIKRVCPLPKPPVRAELIMPIVYRLE